MPQNIVDKDSTGRIFCQVFAKQVVYIEQLILDAGSVLGLSMHVV